MRHQTINKSLNKFLARYCMYESDIETFVFEICMRKSITKSEILSYRNQKNALHLTLEGLKQGIISKIEKAQTELMNDKEPSEVKNSE